MYEHICKGCGKVFTDTRADRVYCSHSCSATNRDRGTGTAHCDTSLEWKRTESNALLWECPYNNAVGCSFRKCDRCGWNPEVAKARTEAFERKLKENLYG